MQKIVTTTAQNAKISANFPARKSPGKCSLHRPLGKSPKKSKTKKKTTRKPDVTSPLCSMNKYKIYVKNLIFFLQIYCRNLM